MVKISCIKFNTPIISVIKIIKYNVNNFTIFSVNPPRYTVIKIIKYSVNNFTIFSVTPLDIYTDYTGQYRYIRNTHVSDTITTIVNTIY